jgi:SAM-dependent methyltransferase
VALGLEVVAVEPGVPMLAQLRPVVPEAEALEGTAESIPLPDASVHAAFAGQAFHWFDRERAVPELRRVLRAGGGLALLWNWWDVRDPLQRDLGELVGYAGHDPYRDDELPGAPWFRELGRTVVETAQKASPDSLAAYLATTSMFVTMGAEERERRLTEVRGIASRYGERFSLPRLTYVFAFERLS